MFFEVKVNVNIDDLVDTTRMSKTNAEKIAQELAQEIVDRYLSSEYINQEDVNMLVDDVLDV
jgi:polyhydroxyalkanoate synthesis regulator phasin